MSRKRRQFSAGFKAKVVLELLQGDQTLAQIASKYEITPKSLIDWKKKFLGNAPFAFKTGSGAEHGAPEIFNSDQGSQYTGKEHTGILKAKDITISMNGKGRSVDNIAIERFFRTLKYEEVYINDYKNIHELRTGMGRYILFYNHNRFHSALGYKKTMQVFG